MRTGIWSTGVGCTLLLVTTVPVLARPSLPVRTATVQKVTPEFLENYREGDSFEAFFENSPMAASSSLRASNGNDYTPHSLRDGNLKTAWVEGARGNGRGEWLEFTFDRTRGHDPLPGNDRVAVTGINFFNGYRKSPEVWKANGRVRELEVQVNGIPKARIQLADTQEYQIVTLPKIALPRGKKTLVRVVIRGVYPGAKYSDTALTELEFEGEGPF